MGAAVGMLGLAGIHLVAAGGGDAGRPGKAVQPGARRVVLVVAAEVAADTGRGCPGAGEAAGEVIDDDGGGFLAIGAVHLIVGSQISADSGGDGPGTRDTEAGIGVIHDDGTGWAAVSFVVLVVAALVTRNCGRCRPSADRAEAGIRVVDDDG